MYKPIYNAYAIRFDDSLNQFNIRDVLFFIIASLSGKLRLCGRDNSMLLSNI